LPRESRISRARIDVIEVELVTGAESSVILLVS